jgi:hypothetical protein
MIEEWILTTGARGEGGDLERGGRAHRADGCVLSGGERSPVDHRGLSKPVKKFSVHRLQVTNHGQI